jgi:nicotinamide-nucleotide amidase
VCERLGDAVFGFGTEGAHEGNHEGLPDCVVRMLAERGMKIATAESCTGGLLAGALTAVPGASEVFDDGRVCYSHEAKIRNLGVPAELLRDHGAVSTAVAESMARGVLEASGSDIAISITGVAGPGGGSPNKPVGSVIFGLADRDIVRTRERRWLGTREEIRAKSVTWALDLVRRRLLERD